MLLLWRRIFVLRTGSSDGNSDDIALLDALVIVSKHKYLNSSSSSSSSSIVQSFVFIDHFHGE